MQAFVAFLVALPKLVELASQVWKWIEKASGGDPEGFILRVNQAFSQLHKAQTEKEMQDAAKAIQDAIRRTR